MKLKAVKPMGHFGPEVGDALRIIRCNDFDILFAGSPYSHIAVFVDLHMNDMRMAANRAVLDVLLSCPRRQIDRHHDLLTAGFADVTTFVIHFAPRPFRKFSALLPAADLLTHYGRS